MITIGIEVTVFKATIFNEINNGNKTEKFLVKVNHLNLFPIATKKYLSKVSVRY